MLKAFLFFLATHFSCWTELALKKFPNDFSDDEKSSLISNHFKHDNPRFVAFVNQEKLWKKGWKIFSRLIFCYFREEATAIAKQYTIKLKAGNPDVADEDILGDNECYLYLTPNNVKRPGGWSFKKKLEFMIKDAWGLVIKGEIDGYSFDRCAFFEWSDAFECRVAKIRDDMKLELFEILLEWKEVSKFLRSAAVHQPLISEYNLSKLLVYGINHYQGRINQISKVEKTPDGNEFWEMRGRFEQSFLNTLDFLTGNKKRAKVNQSLVKAVLLSPVWQSLYDTSQKIDLILSNCLDKDFYSFLMEHKVTIDLVGMLTNGDARWNNLLKDLAGILYELNYFDATEISRLQSKWSNFLGSTDDNTQTSYHDSIFFEDDPNQRKIREKIERCDSAQNYLADNTDIYEKLGLSHTATEAEIKKAYYKMALKYNPNDPKNKSNFQEIANMKEILDDPDAKAIYDKGYFSLKSTTLNI